jgi:hypothetical protein
MMSDYEAKDTFQKLLLQTFFERRIRCLLDSTRW